MHKRLDIGGWRFYVAITHSGKVEGVNSCLEDGSHFLMWDFDHTPEAVVAASLQWAQLKYKLPNIHLIGTGINDHFHAYCFERVTWPQLLHILADTPKLDPFYFKIGVIRGHFTLRISDKRGRNFGDVKLLVGYGQGDLDPQEIKSFTDYWTKRL